MKVRTKRSCDSLDDRKFVQNLVSFPGNCDQFVCDKAKENNQSEDGCPESASCVVRPLFWVLLL